ncbi:MAG TPA: BLUF domain-containing protein [Polyangiaceae bacterium]|jgi:hypothetical protein|nr:BLUF domain-containing protein [Polyangiaceae bacterium]
MPTQAVHELIYVSAAVTPMDQQELAALLLKARANNKRLDVSGILVHHEGSFLQVLEGDPTVVEPLFARIQRDKRHQRTLVLQRGLSPQRSFGDWSMGFVEADPRLIKTLPGFNDFFRRGFRLTQISSDPGRVKQLLDAFREGRFHQHVRV